MKFRSLFLVSVAAVLSFAWAGCGSDDDSTTAPAAGSAGKVGTAGSSGAGAHEGGAHDGEAGSPAAEAGEGGTGGEISVVALPTLDGSVPLVIGHRGLPGLHPEET